MATRIRSSSQLYVDDNLVVNGKKITSLAAGTASGDGVEFDQLNTAINNAVAGAGNSIHAPVADLTAAKTVTVTDVVTGGVVTMGGRTDKMIMLIESLGLYRFDAESVTVSNDGTVIRPMDVASDAAPGRWIKMSSILTDHSLLDNIQGAGEFHLSQTELTKLGLISDHADVTDATTVGAVITGVAAVTAIPDTDEMPVMISNVLKTITWLSMKGLLKTYFDSLYNKYVHPNHTGDVTSAADGAQTIAANVVTNAKLADMATATIKGRTTAATGDPEDLTKAQVLAMLNVVDGANKYVHPNHTGDVTSVADGTTAIGLLKVVTGMIADGAVTAPKIASDAVTTIKILDANVTTPKIADGNVTDVKLAANAVTAAKILDANVTTTKIADKNVTLAKIADIATASFVGRNTAATGVPEVLTIAQVKAMLGLIAGNLSVRIYHATPSGAVTGSNCAFVIAGLILSGTESVFRNGIYQNAGAGNDYTILSNTPVGSTTINFVEAPSNTPFVDTILVDYNV
jgi:hypothetical protein